MVTFLRFSFSFLVGVRDTPWLMFLCVMTIIIPLLHFLLISYVLINAEFAVFRQSSLDCSREAASHRCILPPGSSTLLRVGCPSGHGIGRSWDASLCLPAALFAEKNGQLAFSRPKSCRYFQWLHTHIAMSSLWR